MGVVIQAVESNSNSNLLSTPSIMTLDNEEAEIIVGENVPFITGTSLSSNNDNPFQTIERQDVGLTLRVTPQINDGNVVRLQLVQEVSNVSNETISGAADISTKKRSVKSVILANNREIIVTGGLVRDDLEEVVKKVPLQESYCGSYGGEKACPERHVPKGRPNCISYNSGTGRAQVIAKKHGLADSVMLVLRLQLDKYPASARFSGVHVQLHSQCSHTDGTCPSELSASLISAPGAARFFRISKVAHHYNNGSQTEHFEAKDSDAGDHNFEAMFGPRKDTVVLVFYYATLSQLLIRELPKYSWLNLSAEMGGIMGLLFGVGIVNVTTWLLKACFLGKHSLRHGLTRHRKITRGLHNRI